MKTLKSTFVFILSFLVSSCTLVDVNDCNSVSVTNEIEEYILLSNGLDDVSFVSIGFEKAQGHIVEQGTLCTREVVLSGPKSLMASMIIFESKESESFFEAKEIANGYLDSGYADPKAEIHLAMNGSLYEALFYFFLQDKLIRDLPDFENYQLKTKVKYRLDFQYLMKNGSVSELHWVSDKSPLYFASSEIFKIQAQQELPRYGLKELD